MQNLICHAISPSFCSAGAYCLNMTPLNSCQLQPSIPVIIISNASNNNLNNCL